MIIPAILETSFEEAERKIHNIQDVSSLIEIDFIDNTSTKGLTFLEFEKIKTLKTKSEIIIHFQVEDPLKYLKKGTFLFPILTAKVPSVSTIITQLTDANENIKFINFCRKLGYKVGVSIDPDKEVESILPFLDELDLIQFMSVIPGRQGGDFIPQVLDKIVIFKTSFPSAKTHIDGGIDKQNLLKVIKTGVDNIVVGSAIFNTSDPIKEFLDLSSIFEEERKTARE